MPPNFRLIITGIVQGVGFRPFLFNLLRDLHCIGTIQNSGNMGVLVEVDLTRALYSVQQVVNLIRQKAPPIAFIEDIEIVPISDDYFRNCSDLRILPSGEAIGKSLALPPDIALCDQCLIDFQNSKLSRYYHYPFIACAQCGPRFTTMKTLPYDRNRSTMDVFPLCEGPDSCDWEYKNPNDRRFHAQTFACRRCGPIYFQANNHSPLSKPSQNENIEPIIRAIQTGKTVAVKGIGGIFLICDATNINAIQKLRDKKKGRPYKPFAIMMPDLATVRHYCQTTPEIERELSSFRRPIVLCEVRENALPPNIAPGLAHIGVILPYTGVHYLLFDRLGAKPLVYTSGNLSGLPMAIENNEIMTQLVDLADFFYLHNRDIYQRCDDSVLRQVLGTPTLIRRSRGYVPEYIKLPFNSPFSAMIAMGAEENNTGAIARNNRIFPTQHIGTVSNLEIGSYLDASLRHMQQLLKIEDREIKLIARDLHPTFHSSQIAAQWKERLDPTKKLPEMVMNVQHHHAHMGALMMDNELPLESQIVAITIDGYGYGCDKQAWGGEILIGGYSKFERAAWLKPVPMVGGDLCTEWPYRMLLCELFSDKSIDESMKLIQALYSPINLASHFPHKESEVTYLIRNLGSPNTQSQIEFYYTSGLGRWLDAAAALFDVCDHRTYRGEPAMRFEGFAWNGHYESTFNLDSYLEGSIIRGDKLLQDYAQYLSKNRDLRSSHHHKKDLATSVHYDIASLFARQAIRIARSRGIHQIGVSGGVAYNELIMHQLQKEITSEGFEFLQHHRIPPGDAGISCGQLAVTVAQKLD